jgi:general secretion pathway protein D
MWNACKRGVQNARLFNMNMNILRASRRATAAVMAVLLGCTVTPQAQQANTASQAYGTPFGATQISLHLRGETAYVMRASMDPFHLHLNFVDPPVPPSIRIDIDDADQAAVQQALSWLTHMFFIPVGAGQILVAADTPANRAKYRSTAYYSLTGLNTEDRSTLHELLSRILELKGATESAPGTTLQADQETLYQADKLIDLVKQPVPDLLFKICVYTIEQSHESNLGVQTPSTTKSFSILSEAQTLISDNQSLVNELISAGTVSSSNTLEIALILLAAGYTTSNTKNGFVTYGGGETYMGMSFDSPSVNLSLSDSRLHRIAENTLRVADRQSATLRIGERYPVKVGSVLNYSYSSSSSSWTSSTTPSVQYEDLGLTLQLEPHLMGNSNLYLNLDWKNQALTGQTVDDVPVLDRRQFSDAMIVPLHSTVLLTGHVGRKSVGDTSGLASNSDASRSGSELLITITPELAQSSPETAVATPRDAPDLSILSK